MNRVADNPTNAVGGLFIRGLQARTQVLLNPTNAVGGSFIPSLTDFWLIGAGSDMNDPPTALVGFGSSPECSV